MSTHQALTVSNNWLDSSVNVQQRTSVQYQQGSAFHGWYVGDYWYPWIKPVFWVDTVVEQPKIRLKLSEVERLREAAGQDEALRATLQKFTPYIEIEVDF